MQLLLEFVNTKTWSDDSLQDLHRRFCDVAASRRRAGNFDAYENAVQDRYGGVTSLYGLADASFSPHADIADLSELQHKWRDRLKKTANQGPDPIFLNDLAKSSEFFVWAKGDPFSPKITPRHNGYYSWDKCLEGEYFAIFLEGRGGEFRKLKECDNPKCKQMFLSNRKTHRFCQEACRHQFHNEIKIKSGYSAKYQAAKRAAGDPKYMR